LIDLQIIATQKELKNYAFLEFLSAMGNNII